jgi:hypothetical protein
VEFQEKSPDLSSVASTCSITASAVQFREQVTYISNSVSIELVPSTFTVDFIKVTMEAACLVAERLVIPINEKKDKSSVTTQLMFSFVCLAVCFGLNQSIIRPLYKINSRYNVVTRLHAVLSLLFCGIPHNNFHYNKIVHVTVNDPL